MTRDSALVAKAKRAASKKLAQDVPTTTILGDRMFTIFLLKSAELTQEERAVIWTIADTNMGKMSASSSMGWVPKEKKQELFDSKSRFILVCSSDAKTNLGSDELPQRNPDCIVAFSMFRFEYEEEENLLYCYEVQLVETCRRIGLGNFLVHELISIARKWKMDKIMLTCLKANDGGLKFYKRLGFELDPASPDYVAEDDDPEDATDCDYQILSVSL